MDQTTELMLELLRSSLNERPPQLPALTTEDWEKIYWLSRKHGVVTMINDVIEQLPEAEKPQGDIALSWELSAERTHYHFAHQEKVLESIRKKADEAGIHMILIKGMGLAKLYPKPNSRACGDIDIYFPNNYQKGNEILGNPDATLDGKHAEMAIDGVTVENHLHFLDQNYISQRKAEKYILSTLKDATPDGDLSPMGNMVYLLMHTVCHLTAKIKLPLRNVVDWGIFLKSYQQQLDPKKCHNVMRSIHMDEAFNILTYLAEEFIESDLSKFINKEILRMDDVEKLRIMILAKDYMEPVPKELKGFQRLKVRYQRNRKRRWLYRYLPSNAIERIWGNIFHIFYKEETH